MSQKLLKSEKLRLKNDRLRKKGKDPLKGSNPMVDSGFGIGGSQASFNKFDKMGAAIEDQKNGWLNRKKDWS